MKLEICSQKTECQFINVMGLLQDSTASLSVLKRLRDGLLHSATLPQEKKVSSFIK